MPSTRTRPICRGRIVRSTSGQKDHATTSLYDVRAFPRDVVLVFGSERFGLPRAIIDAASDVIGIPMYGVNHSFPVTVAAGIVMSEWARRRYASGAIV